PTTLRRSSGWRRSPPTSPSPPQTLTLSRPRPASEAPDFPPPLLPTTVDQILARIATEDQMKGAMRQITAILRERHHIRAGQAEDFNLRDMAEISKAMGSTTKLMGGLLLCVALISLVVGGVGIMNILLVS